MKLALLTMEETAACIIEAIEMQNREIALAVGLLSCPKAIDRGTYVEVVWEEGPYEWPYCFPFGGVNAVYGVPLSVPDVSAFLARHGIQAGEHFDSQTHYSVAVYKATETDWL